MSTPHSLGRVRTDKTSRVHSFNPYFPNNSYQQDIVFIGTMPINMIWQILESY